MNRALTIITFLVFSIYLHSQELPSPKNSLTVVFYNVENLFDTNNDPGTNDDEFTPQGIKQWNDDRYQKKISDLAKVLSSVNERELPAQAARPSPHEPKMHLPLYMLTVLVCAK